MSVPSEFVFYGYFRSSATFRVRIALNLKGVAADPRFVHLLRGDQHAGDYKIVNPQELVPALRHEGHLMAQSLAIIEYLEETVPEPPLLPRERWARARVRQIAQTVACDVHPLNNLRVLKYLKQEIGVGEEARSAWQRHWIQLGFGALETFLSQDPATGRFCHGDSPTLADVCLVPQMANARRLPMDLQSFPTLCRIEAATYQVSAFQAARPENQPDAE